jgi:hypothetical protein
VSPLAGERIPREGECTAVERFHRGAPSPFTLALWLTQRAMARSATARWQILYRTAGGGDDSEVSPTGRSSSTTLCFSDLGLGFALFQFDSEIDSFSFPNKIHILARLCYH